MRDLVSRKGGFSGDVPEEDNFLGVIVNSDDPVNTDDTDCMFKHIAQQPYTLYDTRKRKRRLHTVNKKKVKIRSTHRSLIRRLSYRFYIDLLIISTTQKVLMCKMFLLKIIYILILLEKRGISYYFPP